MLKIPIYFLHPLMVDIIRNPRSHIRGIRFCAKLVYIGQITVRVFMIYDILSPSIA